MNMKKNLEDIFKVLHNNVDLLKLLYHLPANRLDNPLTKAEIKSLSNGWEIIDDRIKFTPTVTGFDTPKCRICFYFGKRRKTYNPLVPIQHVKFDVLVHESYNNVDARLSWICDKLNEILFNNRITGMGRCQFYGGGDISGLPEGYIGYQLIYEFGDLNK